MRAVLDFLPFIREIRITLFGWSLFLTASIFYCSAYQIFIEHGSISPSGSVHWALREWGLWMALTPCLLAALRKLNARQINLLYSAFAGLAALLIVISYRVAWSASYESQGLVESIVAHLPAYFSALLFILFGWWVFLKPKAQNQADPEELANSFSDKILVSNGKDESLIELKDIDAVSASGNYVDIFSGTKQYLLRSTLKTFEQQLPEDQFVRIHRSHIVALNRIERIVTKESGAGEVELQGGRILSLSKRYRQALKSKYKLNSASVTVY